MFGQLRYPKVDKKGYDNPIFYTSNSEIGKRPPEEHHRPDRYFPKSNRFSKSFADRESRFAGLVTGPLKSHVHASLDESF